MDCVRNQGFQYTLMCHQYYKDHVETGGASLHILWIVIVIGVVIIAVLSLTTIKYRKKYVKLRQSIQDGIEMNDAR